jgi:hypothetical protein
MTDEEPKHFRSWVAQANTRETDLMDEVPHIVKYTIGDEEHTMEVMAAEPMEAIAVAQYQLEDQARDKA